MINLTGAGHVARMEESRRDFRILTGKPTGKRALGRHRHWWEHSIRMGLKKIVVNMRNWIDSTQDRNYTTSGLHKPWN